MSLTRKLVLEACHQLWEDYHQKIEDLGYTLSKDSLMMSPTEISIVATIRPSYSKKMLERFKEVIPQIYHYRHGKETYEIPVIFFPSIHDLFKI